MALSGERRRCDALRPAGALVRNASIIDSPAALM